MASFYGVSLVGNAVITLLSCMDVHLHTAMYFFLANHSFLDVSFTTSIIPQLLVKLCGLRKTISYARCMAQFYISHCLGATVCILTAIMSYNHYAEVCRPLHYMVLMHLRLCMGLACTSWLNGLSTSLVGSMLTMLLPLCGNNHIYYFFCEIPLIMQLACVGTRLNVLEMYLASFVYMVLPLRLILLSYGHITKAMLSMRMAKGRKPFSTCSSHVAVVSLLCGSIIFMYLKPAMNGFHEQGKFMVLFYTVVMPTLNPLIYTLRNKDMHGVLGHPMLGPCGASGCMARE
ncbi:Olfactory receptor 2C3 [Heterocephalus glaber]|nr:Olfactory receptor 2C3 [Heterocephalus glaber]